MQMNGFCEMLYSTSINIITIFLFVLHSFTQSLTTSTSSVSLLTVSLPGLHYTIYLSHLFPYAHFPSVLLVIYRIRLYRQQISLKAHTQSYKRNVPCTCYFIFNSFRATFPIIASQIFLNCSQKRLFFYPVDRVVALFLHKQLST